jgi:hypothetical protein
MTHCTKLWRMAPQDSNGRDVAANQKARKRFFLKKEAKTLAS